MTEQSDVDKTLELLVAFFSGEWQIEASEHKIEAIQSSGYGSGPAVINLTALANHLHGR
jgi:hypothetical protein